MSSEISTLAAQWLAVKHEENKAIEARRTIEDQMVNLIEIPSEGSKTQKLDGFKITATQPIGRKLLEDEWRHVAHLCPQNLHPIKIKQEADPIGIKWLMQNEPATWAKIAPAFETKPGKVGFKVEVI